VHFLSIRNVAIINLKKNSRLRERTISKRPNPILWFVEVSSSCAEQRDHYGKIIGDELAPTIRENSCTQGTAFKGTTRVPFDELSRKLYSLNRR
jgi:hypothetical protein